jgi:hypothetical protein
MPGTSFSHWTGPLPHAPADGPSSTASDTPLQAVSWMTTNGPLPMFDLVRPRGDGEAADARSDRV